MPFSSTPTPPRETALHLNPHRTTSAADSWNVGALVSLTLLTSAVASIVVIGFLGSYGPLRDAFLAIHQSPAAASRDPWAVDGLIAVATAAAIWLKNRQVAHIYALTVGGVATAASLLLNFLHGCGVIRPGGQTDGPLHPLLVLIITSLPVGAIGFGSHLLIACVRNFRARSRVPATSPGRPTSNSGTGVRIRRLWGSVLPITHRTALYPVRDFASPHSSRTDHARTGPRTGPVPPAWPNLTRP